MKLPPVHADFDYQLGGPYVPPSGVKVVSRDRTAKPADGVYSICYVNAFQAQPDALDWWKSNHPDLLLRRGGEIVMDTDWNEAVLDTSTEQKRTALAAIVGGWIDGCAASGFKAIDPDNLDSFQRSQGALTQADNVAFARLIVQRAHTDGLAAGQKNAGELLAQHAVIGFDFAMVEECGTYNECGGYARVYGGRVYDTEYTDGGLAAACSAWQGKISIIRRDHDLTPAGSGGYVYRGC
ncbi:endo alpha-1,4 polygalactosaminidase [Streptomyces sp. NPDC059690]|uniref:endo alpha-1,4 polygalactosaminidase n=1 Tax=Streptomyces sp. NPDC059690 TaxID=3346907 RepID=UPI0036789F95